MAKITANMQDQNFYKFHLNQVSRSFSFCIERLKDPLQTWVGLSYLLCRVLDTAEDAIWENNTEKLKSLSEFNEFLEKLPSEEQVRLWNKNIPQEIKAEERELVEAFYLLLQDLHSLPNSVKAILQKSIVSMNKGMSFFSAKNKVNELFLNSLFEVNTYCFFVAGLVGELLTDLLKEVIPENNLPKGIYLKAHHFGLFLQKINLLKDQSEDKKLGRFLVPARENFLKSLFKNAKEAIDYILCIPKDQKEFRLFCAWSLFLGLSSLSFIESSFLTGISSKIPRWMTEKILKQVEVVVQNDQELQKLFNEMLPSSSESLLVKNNSSEFCWILSNLYNGPISSIDLVELGIV